MHSGEHAIVAQLTLACASTGIMGSAASNNALHGSAIGANLMALVAPPALHHCRVETYNASLPGQLAPNQIALPPVS